ncbi:MAG: DNA recombination protein RmuC [Candidatus Aminicenantes bacterium]|nr:DNA recombination protein RmuC [Candidatus Aminicenantes bacterium]
MNAVVAFAGGVVLGALITVVVFLSRKQDSEKLAQELVRQAESRKIQDLDKLLGQVKESFQSLSLDVLGKSSETLVRLADEKLGSRAAQGEQELDKKKSLIDQNVETMRGDVKRMQELVAQLERDRQQKFGELTAQLEAAAKQTGKLQDTTEHLRQALGSTKSRGQWGERMAEDVLTLAGFKEGFNYLKQKAMDAAGSRPDFTFLLPQERRLNMDVKFPLDNYLRYLEAGSDVEREKHRKQFLSDVRTRVKEVTTRDYINPEANTLDYVLVFIPNEQVYAFIHENDREILDAALRSKVILCSPITLYAVLAVIRQGMANFNMERTASTLLGLVDGFEKQFAAFVDSFDKMGKKIEDAQSEFKKLEGTRRNKLDRSMEKIKELREEKGLLAEVPVIEAKAVAGSIEPEDEAKD